MIAHSTVIVRKNGVCRAEISLRDNIPASVLSVSRSGRSLTGTAATLLYRAARLGIIDCEDGGSRVVDFEGEVDLPKVSDPSLFGRKKPFSIQWLMMDSLSRLIMESSGTLDATKQAFLDLEKQGAVKVLRFSNYMPIAPGTMHHNAGFLTGISLDDADLSVDEINSRDDGLHILLKNSLNVLNHTKVIHREARSLGFKTTFTLEMCNDLGFDGDFTDTGIWPEYCFFAEKYGYEPFTTTLRCLGDRPSHDVVLSQTLSHLMRHAVPEMDLSLSSNGGRERERDEVSHGQVFSYVQVLQLHESTGLLARRLDGPLSVFLRALSLSPTALIFAADHGSR